MAKPKPALLSDHPEEATTVCQLIQHARIAMTEIAECNQERIDELVTAVAWSLYKPENARRLAQMAVADTGIGNVEDKVVKNQRKTFGTLRDLMRARTVGIIDHHPERGLVRYAKPVGVVAAITPSTNPSATPVNKAMMALKGANAIVIAPSPSGWTTSHAATELMRKALTRANAPADLVQVLPAPVSRRMTQILMQQADLVVTTGSQNNVRSAYSSGTPTIGVGAGNVPVVIDRSANLDEAAKQIVVSKTFDNSTSCSSENSLVILDEIYEDAIRALMQVGAHRSTSQERDLIANSLWHDGILNRNLIARDADVFARTVGLADEAANCRFFLVEEPRFDPHSPFADENFPWYSPCIGPGILTMRFHWCGTY